MAAEHGSSDRASSKRRQKGDSSDSHMRGLSLARTREAATGQTIADSPKRFSVDGTRIEAASSLAPPQDMTITNSRYDDTDFWPS